MRGSSHQPKKNRSIFVEMLIHLIWVAIELLHSAMIVFIFHISLYKTTNTATTTRITASSLRVTKKKPKKKQKQTRNKTKHEILDL